MNKRFLEQAVSRIKSVCKIHHKRIGDDRLICYMIWPERVHLTEEEIMALVVESWEIRSAGRFAQKFVEFAEKNYER